jgi:hypothetical protein
LEETIGTPAPIQTLQITLVGEILWASIQMTSQLLPTMIFIILLMMTMITLVSFQVTMQYCPMQASVRGRINGLPNVPWHHSKFWFHPSIMTKTITINYNDENDINMGAKSCSTMK